MGVTVHYFAAAKAALGVGEETLDADGQSIGALLIQRATDAAAAADPAATSPGADVTAVLARCSFLHNGHATTDRATVLADGDTLDVLPPFAGG